MTSKKTLETKGMPSLETQRNDILVLLAKAGLGAVPYAGSLLAELIGFTIPNQRIDRLVRFAEKLNLRLSEIEKTKLNSMLSDDEFIGILEEAIAQASRSTTDKRREYLASIIANGLSSDAIEQNETRRILSLLSELNDSEIIILRSYLIRTIGGDEEFREKHKDVIRVQTPTSSAPQSEKDKAAINKNYKEHLTSLGLLENEYRLDRETGLQEIDTFTNAPKIVSKDLTSMGRVFLRRIGFIETK